MPILRGIVPALIVACALGTAIGCSSSGDSGGATPDGGTPTGEGGPGTDGGGPGTDAGRDGSVASCTVNGTNILASEPKQIFNLEIAGTSLVFLSNPAGAAPPASIEKMNLDGSNRTTIYTSAGDRRIHSMHVQGDTVYFFEEDNAAVDPKDELWSIPLAGGTQTQVGTIALGTGPRFIGSDAANLYISGQSGNDNTFDRVVLASSTMENIALLTDHGTIQMTSISGTDIFFWSAMGGTGGAPIVNDVFHFAKTATAATPTALPGHLEALCDIATGGVFTTPTKVGCGFTGLNAYNHDGTGLQTLIQKNAADLGPWTLVGSDAETFYTYDRGKALAGAGNISKIASTGGAITPIACDVKPIENHLLNAFFPVQTEYEVVIGATDVFWIEAHQTAGTTTYALRRAPK